MDVQHPHNFHHGCSSPEAPTPESAHMPQNDLETHSTLNVCPAPVRSICDTCLLPICKYARANPWIFVRGRPLLFLSLPSLSLSSLLLPFPCPPLPYSSLPLSSYGAWGSAVSPHRILGRTNLVHYRAVRKSLVAIMLTLLKCVFYSRTTTIWHST